MDNSSCMDLKLENIWESWRKFRKGKTISVELDEFQYYLERNLYQLYLDLNSGQYRHGGYRKFIVADNKKREVSVASIRDRVVHRLLYEYLVPIYDKTFILDVWSCRKGKGLTGAIERTGQLLARYNRSFVWRSDIKKFFDHVNHAVLASFIENKVTDSKALRLLKEVINSYEYNSAIERERERE
ncbi:MAG: reverse transcriptase domain-containing protein [Candidatus Taylorbacteria bacterium]|nr:reverse transcriptase domain-containing protein [Candidatus Taylorbacteria bacterium]